MAKDWYIERVNKGGDDISGMLRKMTVPSLSNNEFLDVLDDQMNGMVVMRIPEGFEAVCHAASGSPLILNQTDYVHSMVRKLKADAEKIGATPLGFADDINASGNIDSESVGNDLNEAAGDGKSKVGVINGEFANLGNRVRGDFNINGVMVSMVRKGKFDKDVFTVDGTTYVKFDPQGKAVWLNSDGEGTKAEFAERLGKYYLSLYNSIPMKADDSAKKGARIMAVFDTIESRNLPMRAFWRMLYEAGKISKIIGAPYVLLKEEVGGRLMSYRDDIPALNVGGSAVSVIDEERIKNPLAPSAGDYLLVVRGLPGPRSNGISDKRKLMTEVFGQEWHKTPMGKVFMEFLSQPSTLFYNVFNELMDSGVGTSFTHMSGGAFDSKLAKELAKHGLYARLDHLFPPDWRELAIAGFGLNPPEHAYAKWPMGNEGVVFTKYPGRAMRIIKSHGLEAMVAGVVHGAKAVLDDTPHDGFRLRTGIELIAYNGQRVYFSGQK